MHHCGFPNCVLEEPHCAGDHAVAFGYHEVPPESETRPRASQKCTHLDMVGDSTMVVNADGRAWCEQCGQGRPPSLVGVP